MRTDVNYTKIVDELESLRAENAALRDRLHRPCSGCPGCGTGDCPDALDVALSDAFALRDRVAVLEKSIRWALGEVDMDGWFPLQGPNDPRYWWRSGLRSRAALAAAKPAENGAGGA